jgi:hypothetical protein
MMSRVPPSLTLPLKGGGDVNAACHSSPSPLEGEGGEGGGNRTKPTKGFAQ